MCHYLLVDSHVPFPSHSLVLLVSPLAYASHLLSLSFSHTLIYCNNTNLKPTPTICSPLHTHSHHPSRAHSIIYLLYLPLSPPFHPQTPIPKAIYFSLVVEPFTFIIPLLLHLLPFFYLLFILLGLTFLMAFSASSLPFYTLTPFESLSCYLARLQVKPGLSLCTQRELFFFLIS